MSIFDRIFGNQTPEPVGGARVGGPARSENEIAVERYQYLLRTAPPETIE